MVDRRITVAAGWALRLISWLTIAVTLALVVWRHEAINLRSQFARLMIPDQREAALQTILSRPGLASCRDANLDLAKAVQVAQSGLVAPVEPGPRILVLREGATPPLRGTYLDRLIYVVFDENGKVVGAPLSLPYGGRQGLMRSQHTIEHRGRTRFLILVYYTSRVVGQLAAGRRLAICCDVYDLTGEPQRKVLSVTCLPKPRTSMFLVPEKQASEAAACRLLSWTFAGPGAAAQAHELARFIWNEESQTFLGPAAGSNGLWEVTDPSPYRGPDATSDDRESEDSPTGP